MREHTHSPRNICPGCLNMAAERFCALEAIAVKDSARAERAEAEVVRLSLEADDFRDDYREELSAYRMSAKRAEARLAEAERHLREHGCDFYHSGKTPRDCPECSHFPPERRGRAEDRERGT